MVNLMNKKWWYFGLSIALIIPGLIFLLIFGLRLGIDFTGGTLLEYKFAKSVDKEQLRQEILEKKIEISQLTLTDQTTYTIKLKPIDDKKIAGLKNSLKEKFGNFSEQRTESVGPVVGAETTRNAFLALILAAVMIVIYLALAFRKIPKPASSWRFGIAAVVALLHDVLVVVGVFAILGHFYNVEVDILFMTAVLTVIGFSVHDTIVVFDRIRENLSRHLSENFEQVANISIAQTLGRSLNTSLTVVFVLLALLLFGGESLRWFIVALLVGIVSGTYSSIFNATALLVWWEEKLGH